MQDKKFVGQADSSFWNIVKAKLRVSVSICGNFQTGEANETLTYSKALKY
jgi:hypothetical protein